MRSPSRVLPAVLSVALLAAGVLLAGCSSTATTATTATSGPGATGATVAPGSSAPATTAPVPAANLVTVKTFQFKPATITVKAGTPVQWQNEDEITHEPTAGAPGATTDVFKPVTLDGKGATGAVTITTPGTYPYFCAVHESMSGQITVT